MLPELETDGGEGGGDTRQTLPLEVQGPGEMAKAGMYVGLHCCSFSLSYTHVYFNVFGAVPSRLRKAPFFSPGLSFLLVVLVVEEIVVQNDPVKRSECLQCSGNNVRLWEGGWESPCN